ncbi:MAG: hypothetical protein ACREJ3_04200, partial [Polyangiaceae bacterium]
GRVILRDHHDAVGRVLLATSALPAAALVALCLWSPVAEPHWLAPALLALCPALARSPSGPPRGAIRWTVGVAGGMVAAVYAWVLVPACARIVPTDDAQLNLANELYGWPEATAAVIDEIAAQSPPSPLPGDVVVVGPHWVICAQIEVALRTHGVANARVGCDTPIADDYDTWWPRTRWMLADSIVWVSDTRFGPPPPLAAYVTLRTRAVRVKRGGRVIRTFTITVLTRRAEG